MNRERNLSGVNSYQKDLGFAPLDFLVQKAKGQSTAAWLDLCCGRGRALIQATAAPQVRDGTVKLVGVDLVPLFDPIPPEAAGYIRLIAASLERWQTAEQFDLITCVHGLHYVGDKLGLLQRAARWLKRGGLFWGHLDFRNLRIKGRNSSGGAQIGKDLRRAGFQYSAGRHSLNYHAQDELAPVLPYKYWGADDKAGPNYTGQSAVDSYYERLAPAKPLSSPRSSLRSKPNRATETTL